MSIRYVLTKIDKDGLRSMVSSVQGQYTYSTPEEAQVHLDQLLSSNTQERLVEVFGKQVTGTFKVSPVECWQGHNDHKRYYIEETV